MGAAQPMPKGRFGYPGRSWLKVVVCGAAVSAFAISCGRRGERQTAPGGAALVTISGEVWRSQRATAAEEAKPGALGVGDVLTTGDQGGAVLRLPDGREIEIGPRARVRLEAAEGASGGLTVEVERGAIVSRTPAETAGSGSSLSLSILTPFGITRVPAGPGQASISVGDDGVDIRVAVGELSFVDREGKVVSAKADERIEVTLGGIRVLQAPPEPSSQGPGVVAAIDPLDIVLSSDSGTLLVRRPEEQRFVSRRAAPATAGTAYKVAAQGRARIVGESFTAHLGSRVEGRVGPATRAADGHRYAIALDQGEATITLGGAVSQTLELGGRGQTLTLRATEPTTLSVVSGPKGPTIAVLAGAVEMAAGKTRRRLDPSVLAEVSGKQVSIGPRPVADVILPTTRGLRVHADRLRDVTLSWPAELSGATVEVATDPEFLNIVLSGRVTGTQVTVPVADRRDLYWRVREAPSTPTKVLVGHAKIVPDSRRSVLDLEHPHNLVAETGQATVYFQSVLPAITFSFAARPGASSYRVRVYRAGELGQPLVQREVNDTQCPLAAGALKEGSFLWHVVALDQSGRELGGGRMNKLDLVYDNSLTTLAIGSPKPGQRVTGSAIDVSGVAPLGSRLFVNGRPAPLDEKGRFAMRVGRTQAVVFRLVGRDGAESYWVRKLRS
jgi:hypothetical protein